MSALTTGAVDPDRSAVFLDEIGIGPLWRLRHAAPAPVPTLQADVVAHEGDDGEDAAAPALQPVAAFLPPLRQEAAPPGAPESATEAVAESTAEPMAESITAPLTASIDAPSQLSETAAPPRAVAATAAEAPSAAPPRSITPAPADDDSTAWFDDAPAPPAPVAVTAEAIAVMDWTELKAAAAKCTRCELHRTRKAVVFGRGDTRATLMVLASAPGRADEREGLCVGGEAGVLLDNMLRAGGFGGLEKTYVSQLVKCRPQGGEGAERAPAGEEIAACRPYLERELALTGAGTIVTLGQPALKGLLGPGVPAARGTVQRFGAAAVVATYHPADLLRQGENKAGAWADLCLARRTHDAAGDPA